MDGFSALGPKERARLRQEFVREAGAAFDQMFDPAAQDQLVTLTQREDLVMELGQKLTAKLLQEHVAGDRQVRPAPEAASCCPKCKGAAQRVTKPREQLLERELTTRAGTIPLRREKWKCPKCRIIFFSVRPAAAIGGGGIQSGAAAKDRAAGEPSGVVRRSE